MLLLDVLMEYIFNELKQYVIKEITENVIIEGQTYPNLIKGKKYLIVYYEKDEKDEKDVKDENLVNIKMVEYAGKFSNISPCFPGAYGDLCEGIFFKGIIENNGVSTKITGEYDCNRTFNNFLHKFFELEYNFNEKNILDIYTFIIQNAIHTDIQTDILINSDDVSVCIFSKKIVDKINLV